MVERKNWDDDPLASPVAPVTPDNFPGQKLYEDARAAIEEDTKAILDEALEFGEITTEEHAELLSEWKQAYLPGTDSTSPSSS